MATSSGNRFTTGCSIVFLLLASLPGLAATTPGSDTNATVTWVQAEAPGEPLTVVGYCSDSSGSFSSVRFRIKNSSDAPIYAFSYLMTFETLEQGTTLSYTLMHGDKILNGPTSVTPGTPFVAPGTSVDIVIPKAYADALDRLVVTARGVHRGVLRLAIVNFGGGNSWVLRTPTYKDIPLIGTAIASADGRGAPSN